MTWVKLDDRFFMEKARPWGLKGRSLYLVGLCYCNRELTDGIIRKNMVPVLLVEAEVAKPTVAVLVSAGVWIDEGDHYHVHDYIPFQESKEQVLKKRAKWRRQKIAQAADSTPTSTGGNGEVPRAESANFRGSSAAVRRQRSEVRELGTYITEVVGTDTNETDRRLSS